MAAMGVDGPHDLRPHMLRHRIDPATVRSSDELFERLAPGELLESPPTDWAADWKSAGPDRFAP